MFKRATGRAGRNQSWIYDFTLIHKAISGTRRLHTTGFSEFGGFAVSEKTSTWTDFCADEAGATGVEYAMIVAGIGVVLAGVLTSPQFGVSALYRMIFNAIAPTGG